jgi:hypothetical protein
MIRLVAISKHGFSSLPEQWSLTAFPLWIHLKTLKNDAFSDPNTFIKLQGWNHP